MQALILVGGEGTRLRPLTSTVPKPVVPLVDRPFIAYMLEWLGRHGVDDVILSCGFMADGVRGVLGDGERFGIRLRYLEEPRPLGTGGALKFAEELLDERFFMLNGDVLTDMDLTAQLEQHERTGARATLALVAVDDPSRLRPRPPARGPLGQGVPREAGARADRHQPDQRRRLHPRARRARRRWPRRAPTSRSSARCSRRSSAHGLFGHPSGGYWLDIGTPERYLQATYDILEGNVDTEVGRRLAQAGVTLAESATDRRAAGRAGAGRRGLGDCGRGDRRRPGGARARRDRRRGLAHRGVCAARSATVGAHSTISDSIIAPRVTIGDGCHIQGGVVIGEGVRIGSENILAAGARIFPGVELPKGAIKF